MRMDAANPILFSVSRVVQRQGGTPFGTASGFFYESGKQVFFVTNRHVVLDESKGTRADELILSLHIDASDITKSAELIVPLQEGGRSKWLVHPKYPKPPVDIAVIQLPASGASQRFIIQPLSATQFFPNKFTLSPGDDALVIGYPRGLFDAKNNLPIVRSAVVASAPGIPFDGQPYFLIDANLHPGTSGSPVLTRPRNDWPTNGGTAVAFVTGSPMFLLGVHSATLSFKLPGGSEPAGLAQVWNADLIEEIIKGQKAG
jgi:S1-C subfamily serine protease